MTEPLWTPDQQRIKNSNVTRYLSFLTTEYGLNFEHYQQLHQWSIDCKAQFWASIIRFFDLKGNFELNEPSKIMVQAPNFYQCRWFPTSTLNFAENLLNPSITKRDNSDIAIIERGEDGRRREFSYENLTQEVTRIAAAMRELGIAKGDCVAAFLPNCAEAVIAMLATASIGAIWSSCSPDFGLNGVIDRFGQIKPKLLFATNGYNYAGKRISSGERVKEIVDALNTGEQAGTLLHLIIVEYLPDESVPQCAANTVMWTQLAPRQTHSQKPGHSVQSHPLPFEPMNFSDPLYIMYSSGTTGVPKCIGHSVGGTLVQHVKELGLHTDLKSGDTLFYYTTCGWMMWNWLVSGLSQGASLVLYDGSPFHPTPQILFDIAEEEKVSVFGGSAKYYSACEKAGLRPIKTHNLTKLKTMLSTGSPLSHESFDYIYQNIKSDLCLSSISGGTDIISCFVLGMPTLPVYRGELQCVGLGMDVAFFDEQGRELKTGKGELVCKTPFPSMPVGFWKDEDNSKYKKAYFNSFDNIWAHGDYGEFVPHHLSGSNKKPILQQGVIIYGRSDAVLNPGGVRIGTAEIYRQVDKIEAVLESVAIGQQWQNDVRIVLFVKLKDGLILNESLGEKIRSQIRSNTTPRHVPAKIIQVTDIPRTISGKIVELAVRNMVHGIEVKNKDALANPEALEFFRGLTELNN